MSRMSDLGHRATNFMADHPDVAEMRARYARIANGRPAVALDGLVLLIGLYTAISPWVVHFRTTSTDLMVNNLITGILLTVMALGLATIGERMYRLVWACVPIGVWMIISPWVVTAGHSPNAGMIWNNVWLGALTFVVGLVATGLVLTTGRRTTA